MPQQNTHDDHPAAPRERRGWFHTDRPIWLLTGVAALLVLAVLVAPGLFGARAGSRNSTDNFPWHTDYRAAARLSAEQGKPMLVNFTADWCGPCQHMNATVYSEAWVVQALNERVIPVKVDMTAPGDHELQLARQYATQGVPTQVIVGPNGREMARHLGAISAEPYVEWIDATLHRTGD